MARLRARLLEEEQHGMLVSELDEVAWLFNLRGEGETHNEGLYHSPTFQSLSLVTGQVALIGGELVT